MPPQSGRRFFITGANSGIGYAAAVELARKGATVVLACRDRTRGEAALRQLEHELGSGVDAELVVLDLASLASVREVAEREVARRQPLHGLLNNAGVMRPPRRLETKDGFELQFGTNVLGHFALTCRLMEALLMPRSTRPDDAARIVTVSSIAHKRVKLDFDDLQAKRSYNPMRAYGQSKLANLMFAFALERRLRAQGKGAVSIAVHPGVAESNLFKIGGSKGIAARLERALSGAIGAVLNNSPRRRAAHALCGDGVRGRGWRLLRSAGLPGDAWRRCRPGVRFAGCKRCGVAGAPMGELRSVDRMLAVRGAHRYPATAACQRCAA